MVRKLNNAGPSIKPRTTSGTGERQFAHLGKWQRQNQAEGSINQAGRPLQCLWEGHEHAASHRLQVTGLVLSLGI
ncbi:MAG TPA: hypothetical protein VFV92_06715, partial [Candidatus Bathyarchaeia archaeon]|nr:hypothetical protein [Candidatus Bathyarchaeia archaeon]